ncbi:MAG: nuclear transport factor 2 family protein [Ktedonobacteraceae bacterium]|nr:nuclear transport factor 2 family protein [Ktedonobacteraceae bacterium]
MNTLQQNTDESQIRELVEAWAQAVQRHDLDGVIAHHSSDILMFDVTLPPQLKGIEAYKESWTTFFAWLGDSGTFELSEFEATGSTDVAFCHGIIHCTGASSTRSLTIRLTIGLKRIEEQWMVIHEHHSEAQPS